MATLLETYQNRLRRADKASIERSGKRLTESKKYEMAQIFRNVSTYVDSRARLTEALDNSIGVQTKDLGAFKRFILDITEESLPNLIAPMIAKVFNMDAMTGYATYLNYTANSRKGVDYTDHYRMNVLDDGIYTGDGRDILRGTFENGKPQDKYTSRNIVIPPIELGATTTKFVLRWAPVLPGSIKVTVVGDDTYYDNGIEGASSAFVTCPTGAYPVVGNDGKWHFFTAAGVEVAGEASELALKVTKYGTTRDVHAGDMVAAGTLPDAPFFGLLEGNALKSAEVGIEYAYENDYVPQNDIPLIGVTQKGIELVAKPRRLAIVFSQFAEFIGQKDYGLNLSDRLKKQAEFQIQLEIDNEVVGKAIECGNGNVAAATWYTKNPVGISLKDHYESIASAVAEADAAIYAATQKYTGTYILLGPKALRFFSMSPNFKPLSSQRFGIGAYQAGEILDHKVIVSNLVSDDDIFVGVNTEEASAILLGMYMPIMSTQLLQMPDGLTTMGFATLYDCKVINSNLVRKIDVVEGREPVAVEGVENGTPITTVDGE